MSGSANSHLWLNQFILGDGKETVVPFTEGSGQAKFSEAFSDGDYEFVYAGYGTADELKDLDITDKIILVMQGGPGDDPQEAYFHTSAWRFVHQHGQGQSFV